MSDNIEVKFKCVCGEHSFNVRYRKRDEDLIKWMDEVVRAEMGKAHVKASPLCMSQTCDLMLPISEGAKGIGMRTEN